MNTGMHVSALTLCVAACAAGQSLDWITQIGTMDYDEQNGVAPDGAGGCYAVGTTEMDIGGGPIVGFEDAWLARFDRTGARLWTRQIGGPGYDWARAVAADGSGGVYICGYTDSALGGPHVGYEDVWLARYNSDGDQLWIQQFGSPQADVPEGLASLSDGGVVIGGHTRGSLGGPIEGDRDIWLARFDSDSERLWITQFGTPQSDTFRGCFEDASGDLLLAGKTKGSLGGPRIGADDPFVARFGADGSRIWLKQFGTAGVERGVGRKQPASDGAGGLFISGHVRSDPAGPFPSSADAYVARHDMNGDEIWRRYFGTPEDDRFGYLASDGAGGVVAVGDTDGELFGEHVGRSDIIIAHLDGTGDLLWSDQFGTVQDEGAAGAAFESGGLFCAGTTYGSLGGPHAGGRGFDIWVARYAIDDVCYADCDRNGLLDFFDFLCFQNLFGAGDPEADCDGSGLLDLFDFLCFQNEFAVGCP